MNWIIEGQNVLIHAVITAVIMLLVTMLILKINGLRSLAKITPLDFIVTITIGSIINSTLISDSNSIVKGGLMIAVLLAFQTLFGKLKAKYNWFDKNVYNNPVLVMRDGEFLKDNISKLNISETIIISKLRENNIKKLSEVQAVILETTGDISVISGEEKMDDILFDNVRFKI